MFGILTAFVADEVEMVESKGHEFQPGRHSDDDMADTNNIEF